MTDAELIDKLAEAIIRKTIERGWVRHLIQDIVLRTVIAQRQQERMGDARAFLECCNDRGIRVLWNKEKRKLVRRGNPLTPDLMEALRRCRVEVEWFLQRHGEMMGAIFPSDNGEKK